MISHHLSQHFTLLSHHQYKLLTVRVCVLLIGIISYALALHADRIKDLVELASSFGSSGLFPVLCFGLFSSVGGTYSAIVSLLSGLVLWLSFTFLELQAPYILSLLGASCMYMITAYLLKEKRMSNSYHQG